MSLTLDHESRANRFLDALGAVTDLLAGRAPGMSVQAEPMAQLMSILNDEARKVVTPFRMGANDDGDDE